MERESGVMLTNEVEVTKLERIYDCEMPEDWEAIKEQHAGWEIIYVDSGNVSIDDDHSAYILKKGEIVCNKPFEKHTIRPYKGKATIICIGFETHGKAIEMLNKKIFLLNNRQKLHFNDMIQSAKSVFSKRETSEIMADGKMYRSSNSSPPREQFIKNNVELLLVLLMNANITEKKGRIALYEHFSQRQTLAKNITEYLQTNIAKPINLNEISNIFSYSLTSIKRIFKEETGSSIIAYLNNLRMQEAKEMLIATNCSIEEIAISVGFSNVHYFSNAFKKRWHTNPSQYRLKNRKWDINNNMLTKRKNDGMFKYKMIIADDEKIISNSLSKMILEECPDIELVGVYNSGQQIIEKLKKSEVDILITDIRMPVKEGLEVAAYIKENNLSTNVIMITGYREFEYARKALECGVYSIITKPINLEKLMETIDEIKEKINEDISKVYRENEKELSIRQVYRQAFFMLVNSNPSVDNALISETLTDLDLREESCVVVDFYAKNISKTTAKYNTMWRDMCEINNDRIDSYCISEYNDVAKFFVIAKSGNEGVSLDHARDFAIETARLMNSAYGFNVEYKVNSLKKLRPASHYNFGEIVNTYINYLILGHTTKKDELLWIVKSSGDSEMLRIFIDELLKHLKISFLPQTEEFEKTFGEAKDQASLLALLNIIEQAVRNCPNGENAIVSVVKNYISHYEGTDYTLQGVADAVAYTPYYLSRVFKNETGENLSDYILSARMDRAKKLLKDKEHNIAYVAKEVGFDNASYFSRIFKKHTGMAPKQYTLIGEKR